MIKILFVDDEPNILGGLQRMLRPLRHEWEMSFANSGEEALKMLEEHHINVIVSDMKMPGMDGAQLFQEVRQRFPHIIRIILSGYSEKEMVMKSVGSAHQYLSKPCDSETLKSTVKRVCVLRDWLANENLRRLISQMPTIPSLPAFYGELKDELSKTEPSIKKVGEIVKRDIGMTVKILQIVNSAFFGLSRSMSDSGEAVEFLGLDTISSLTMKIGVIAQFEATQISNDFLPEIWAHSMAVGMMAHEIALAENPEVAGDAFTAGLLHEIGEVVLAVNLPQQFAEVRELTNSGKMLKHEAEQQIFGATNAEVGAYLLGLWGLPAEIVKAVAYQNTPKEYETDSFTALSAVHIADALQHFASSNSSPETQPNCDFDYLSKLGLLEKIPVWQAKLSGLNGNYSEN